MKIGVSEFNFDLGFCFFAIFSPSSSELDKVPKEEGGFILNSYGRVRFHLFAFGSEGFTQFTQFKQHTWTLSY